MNVLILIDWSGDLPSLASNRNRTDSWSEWEAEAISIVSVVSCYAYSTPRYHFKEWKKFPKWVCWSVAYWSARLWNWVKYGCQSPSQEPESFLFLRWKSKTSLSSGLLLCVFSFSYCIVSSSSTFHILDFRPSLLSLLDRIGPKIQFEKFSFASWVVASWADVEKEVLELISSDN